MRVLALATDGFGGFGGIARYNAAFLRSLAEHGLVSEVVVVPRAGDPAMAPESVQQLPAAASQHGYVFNLGRLLLRDRSFDLVWCGHLHLAPLAAAVAGLLGSNWWLQIHGVDAWARPAPLRARAAARADLVMSVSRHTRRRFLSWSGAAPERVVILPNVVEPRYEAGLEPSALIGRHGLSGKRTLLTVSRLSAAERYKGVDRVIELLPQLLKRYADLVYVVIGDGDDRNRLQALARSKGVGEAVQFVGRVPDAELPEWYRLADIFVMPSTGEGFGIVFLEAMACGVPAVGLDTDGSVDPLSVEPLGHAVPESELLPTLERLLDAPPPRRQPGRLARFGSDAFSEQVDRILGGMTGSRQVPTA